MRTVIAESERICIGKQGENNATEVLFGVRNWREEFGTGTYTLLHKRSGDIAPYPAVAEYTDDIVCWVISASDVEKDGYGEAELTLTKNGTVVKSRTYITYTGKSLPGAGTPPEPYESWVTQVLEAASAAETASEAVQDMTVEGVSGEEVAVEKQVDPDTGAVKLIFTIPSGGGGGTDDHNELYNRDEADQHPISAITGLQTALDGKQPTIADLAAIRSGAALGATALQSHQSLAAYRTAAEQDVIDDAMQTAIDGKQPTIADLAAIRSGAALGATALQSHQSLAAYRTAAEQDVIDAGKYTLPTGGIPKADLSAAVQTSLGKADSAVQDVSDKADKVTGATDGHFAALDDDGNLTDSGKKPSDFAAAEDLETVEAIAKGAQQAVSYGNYATMVTAFNALPATTYKAGQNVMIITLNVPDLWVSSVEQTSTPYTYVDDDTIVEALAEDGYIQVGYYRLSPLETTKVDLSDYATKEELDDKYTLPSGGIPSADLSAAVQGKLLPTADPDEDTGKVLTVDEDTGDVGWRPLPYSWGTEDLTPGVSPLKTGHVYFVIQ